MIFVVIVCANDTAVNVCKVRDHRFDAHNELNS